MSPSFARPLAFLSLLALPSLLFAQKASVSKPEWLLTETQSAPAPEFKRKPYYEYPEELLGTQTYGYVFVGMGLRKDGKYARFHTRGSNELFEDVVSNITLQPPFFKKAPAENELFWYSVLFNPKDADPREADCLPSLLKVRPLPSLPGLPDQIWLTLHVDASGKIVNVDFDDASQAQHREVVAECLVDWELSPAKAAGQPVAASLHLPLMKMPRSTEVRFIEVAQTPPKPLSQETPKYPYVLRRFGIQGKVLVGFIINKEGKVELPFVQESNNPGFNRAAIEAVRQWTFTPAYRNGKVVKARMQVPIIFSLPGATPAPFLQIPSLSKEALDKLPEDLRYEIPPRSKDVILPYYPSQKLLAKEDGSAEVAAIIGTSGTVSELKIIQASSPEFGDSLAATLRSMSFSPALKDGKPCKCLLGMKLSYDDRGSPGTSTVVGSEDDLEMMKLQQKHPERIIDSIKLDKKPRPLSLKPPRQPEELQALNGTVLIELLINEEGRPCLPRVISSPHPELSGLALVASTAWNFEPPTLNRKPVATKVRIPVVFGPPSTPPQSAPKS